MDLYGTLGASCARREILTAMFQAGMTGARLNLSHTTLPECAPLLEEEFWPAARQAGVEASLIVDLQGPELRVGRLAVSVLHTPGHTPGSCCFLCGDALFSGDTLFAGSIGRTDFPGGDDQAMAASLRMLAALEPGIRVFPGHGESTTLSKERMENPYL